MFFRPVLPAVALLAVCVSCAAPSIAPEGSDAAEVRQANVADTVQLRLGQRVVFDAGNFSVQYVRRGEDSRCAIGVQCPWTGDAVVGVALEGHLVRVDTQLHTHLDPREARLGGYVTRLVDVLPYPHYDKPAPAPESTSVRVVVRRAP